MPAAMREQVLHPAAGHKRERAVSTNELLKLDGSEPAAKHQEAVITDHAAPLLPHTPGETKASYFARLGSALDESARFSAAHAFDRDGLYVYKRPVRSAGPQVTSMLAGGGTVFHHILLYLKRGDQLVALEYGPADSTDITSNIMEEAAAGPVLVHSPPMPEPHCLPMLHIEAPLHPLEAPHVQAALRFVQGRKYHALRNNCISFADFAVRVLSAGCVRNAPLVFDWAVGEVPPVDSPLLAFLYMATQLSWFDVCDGGRLMRSFLAEHPAGLLPIPGPGSSDTSPVAAATKAEPSAAAAAAAAAPKQPVAPAESSESEDTVAAPPPLSAAAPATCAAAPPLGRSGSSSVSSGQLLGLPPLGLKGSMRLLPRRKPSVVAAAAAAAGPPAHQQ